MKILFLYPMKVYHYQNKYYAPSITNNILSRYKKIFNSNTVELSWICRIIEDDKNNYESFNDINSHEFHLYNLDDIDLEKKILEFDFVIIRVPNILCSYQASKICKKNNIPYIIEVVGCSFDAFWYHSFKGKIIAPFSYFIHRLIIKNSENVVYVTKNFLQKRYPNNHNNTFISDVELFDDETYKYDPVHKLSLATIGAIDIKYKGHKTVFRAIKKLIDNGYKDIEYRLIGPGNQDKLKRLALELNISNNIEFVGAVPHDDIPKYLKNITFYIQPSFTEGLPRSVIEVESLGIPVISTKVGGMVDVVHPKLQFKRDNYKQLIEIIEKELPNVTLYSKYSLKVSKLFVKDEMEKKLFDFYRKSYERSKVI